MLRYMSKSAHGKVRLPTEETLETLDDMTHTCAQATESGGTAWGPLQRHSPLCVDLLKERPEVERPAINLDASSDELPASQPSQNDDDTGERHNCEAAGSPVEGLVKPEQVNPVDAGAVVEAKMTALAGDEDVGEGAISDEIGNIEGELLKFFEEQKGKSPEHAATGVEEGEGACGVDPVLESVAKSGFRYNAGSTLGKRFVRWLTDRPEEKEKYDAKGRDEKAADRAAWAKKKFDKQREFRKHVTVREDKDKVEGEMLNMDQLIREEGGKDSPAAVQGAMNTARDCIRKGWPWVEKHSQTQRLTFRYLSKSSSTTDAQRWEDGTEESIERGAMTAQPENSGGKRPAEGDHPDASKEKVQRAGQEDAGGTPKGKGKAKAKGKAATPSKAKAKGKPAKSPLKQAEQVLADYLSTTTQAGTMLAKIDNGKWQWEEGDKALLQLRQQFKSVQENASQDEFFSRVLTHGLAKVNSSLEQDKFDSGVLAMLNFRQQIIDLLKEVDRVGEIQELRTA